MPASVLAGMNLRMSSPLPAAQRVIAIVEDDGAVLNSLEFALVAEDYAVCAFAHALEARDSAEILAADCLVVDYAMPDLDGVALLRELRRRGLRSPAIVIASNPTQRCRQDARAVGAPLVEKPLLGDDLVIQVRAALAASKVKPDAAASPSTPS